MRKGKGIITVGKSRHRRKDKKNSYEHRKGELVVDKPNESLVNTRMEAGLNEVWKIS